MTARRTQRSPAGAGAWPPRPVRTFPPGPGNLGRHRACASPTSGVINARSGTDGFPASISCDHAMGKFRGGLTTKMHARVDGNLRTRPAPAWPTRHAPPRRTGPIRVTVASNVSSRNRETSKRKGSAGSRQPRYGKEACKGRNESRSQLIHPRQWRSPAGGSYEAAVVYQAAAVLEAGVIWSTVIWSTVIWSTAVTMEGTHSQWKTRPQCPVTAGTAGTGA
jgi:hypothetical protein